MASNKDNRNLLQPVWDTEQVTLKDFLLKHEVPTVARVVKGQFMNIGTAKFSPLKKLHQDVLVHSIKTGLKILGHSVMKVEARDGRTRRLVSLEQRLSIPVSFKGWFELLSEDGRSVRPLESVQQLAKLYPEVAQVLVRQNVKAYLVNDDGKVTFDKTRVVVAGEQLKLTGDVATSVGSEKKAKLLKCVDSKGTEVYLKFDQTGLFTPIAGPTDVMGVFNVKDIIKRFRLPLTVKLVQGVWPKVDSTRFTGIVRLDWAYTDETAFVCPLDRNSPRIYPIPTDVNLRLVTAVNDADLKVNEAFTNIMVKCNRMVNNYHNTIHLIISIPEGAVKAKSHAFANMYSETKPSSLPQQSETNLKRSKSKEDILLDELDDLYGYLREGKHPPVGKYTRDSDEETYYEEPEFEPIGKFQSRLALLNTGQASESKKNTRYNFVDPRREFDSKHVLVARQNTNGHVTQQAPPVPPELPPRQYRRSDSVPAFLVSKKGRESGSGAGSGDQGSAHTRKSQEVSPDPGLHRQTSKGSTSKGSKDSKSSSENRLEKDSRSSRTGSSKVVRSRKSMPLIYL